MPDHRFLPIQWAFPLEKKNGRITLLLIKLPFIYPGAMTFPRREIVQSPDLYGRAHACTGHIDK